MFENGSGEGPRGGEESLPEPGPATGPAEPTSQDSAVPEPYRSPGQVLTASITGATASLAAGAGRVVPVLPRLNGGEVGAALEDLDTLRAHAETVSLHLVLAAAAQGAHTEKGLSLRDWVTLRCPGLSPHQIGDLITVAGTIGDPQHAQIAEQVFASTLPLRRAAAVLRALDRVTPLLDTTPYPEPDADPDGDSADADSDDDPDTAESADADAGGGGGLGVSPYLDAVHLMLGVAAQPRFSDRDLRRVSDHLVNTVLPAREHESRTQLAHTLRRVNESSLADGSLVRFVITCDPEGAAVFRAVLMSPLAAPCPTPDGHQEQRTPGQRDERIPGQRDDRTPGQRRYDALLTVIRRGLAGGDSIPTTPKATVNVTIKYDPLTRALAGAGLTATGEVLSPATVRRIACDAQLVPMILGSDGEILDQGRAQRLATPGQHRTLAHRDKGCTFPGCSTPASWCEAHHVIHWARGGPSNINNYALLCGRHHTIAHDKDLTATVHPTGVTWHL